MTAVLKKIACNATNSAAIDGSGNLFVWGQTRYGLCGDLDSAGGTAKAPEGGQGKQADGKQPASKSACINEPKELRLLPADYEAEYASRAKNSQEEFFSPFNLLDPDPARKE